MFYYELYWRKDLKYDENSLFRLRKWESREEDKKRKKKILKYKHQTIKIE